MTQITQTSSFNQELLTVLENKNILQDRLPGDVLTLPYNMSEISVNVNDFVTAETINYSFEKLYENWLYLISNSIIPSNNIPNADYYTRFIADTTGDDVNWIDSTTFPSVSSSTTGKSLSGVKNITKIKNTVNPNNFNLIANTKTNVILLSGYDQQSVDVIVNSQNILDIIRSDSDITHPSNNIRFKNIVDHVISDSRELFVLDGDLKSIFKFDISGILTIDKAILNNDTPGRLMTGMMGSAGIVSDKTKFFNPVTMTTVDDLIYILDFDPQTGTVIKEIDSQLNWKKNYNLGNVLSAGPLDIKYNPSTQSFYVLCHTYTYGGPASIPELVVFDRNFNYIRTDKLMDPQKHNMSLMSETYKNIHFSIENPNIFYMITSGNVYKKYVSRATEFIGTFRLQSKSIATGNTDDMNFQDMSIDSNVLTIGEESILKDEIYLLDASFEIIHKFLEDSNYEQSLETKFDDKVLYLSELTIKPDERVNTFVYNKTFLKHIYNNVLILENTSRKFSTTFDTAGISQYIGFQYLNKHELETLNYETNLNNFIGVNEVVTTFTINRCLEQIHSIQKTVLNNMQEKSTNVYPLVSEPVLLPTV